MDRRSEALRPHLLSNPEIARPPDFREIEQRHGTKAITPPYSNGGDEIWSSVEDLNDVATRHDIAPAGDGCTRAALMPSGLVSWQQSLPWPSNAQRSRGGGPWKKVLRAGHLAPRNDDTRQKYYVLEMSLSVGAHPSWDT